jgi:hypothetical protein
MKNGLVFFRLLLLTLILVLAPTTFASTTLYVNGTTGNDSNNCLSAQAACKTIGHAISLATSGDSIVVAAATYSEDLTVNKSLNVIGSSATTTIIDGGGTGIVVTISSGTVHLSNVTIRNGQSGIHNFGTLTISNCTVSRNSGGGGIFNGNPSTLIINNSTVSGNTQRGGHGGGIANGSTGILTINQSTITGNSVNGPFGAGFGGGIENYGTATVSNSTLSGNHATARGGGIRNQGNLMINNSTISGNIANICSTTLCLGSGGGIRNDGGTLMINNSTINGNTAATITANNAAQGGGGIYGSAKIQNSIVANNHSGNCSGTLTSEGYNLSSDGTCNFNRPGDLNNHDPVLGPLQNNGGPTQTIALLPGSPAIDGGNPSGCTDGQGHLLKTDQRGMPRPDKEDIVGCDMGAYERQSD